VRSIRTVLVDDEPLARRRLRDLLANEEDFTIVAECGSGREAVAATRKHRPDLLFLDVQMPELDGFDVLAALGADVPPLVVFVTAFDLHAIRAFEVHALDYLLKPFDRARFRDTLARARAVLANGRETSLERRVADLLRKLERERPIERLAVRSAGRIHFLRVDEIDWIEAAGNYLRLHVGKETHLLRETMSRMEERLDAERFLRVHRSAIVNLDRVREIAPPGRGEAEVLLRDGTRLGLSRGCRDRVERWLERRG